jgi:hypothetical protein
VVVDTDFLITMLVPLGDQVAVEEQEQPPQEVLEILLLFFRPKEIMEALLIPAQLLEQVMVAVAAALVEWQFLVLHLEMVELLLPQVLAAPLSITQVAAEAVDLLQQPVVD